MMEGFCFLLAETYARNDREDARRHAQATEGTAKTKWKRRNSIAATSTRILI